MGTTQLSLQSDLIGRKMRINRHTHISAGHFVYKFGELFNSLSHELLKGQKGRKKLPCRRKSSNLSNLHAECIRRMRKILDPQLINVCRSKKHKLVVNIAPDSSVEDLMKRLKPIPLKSLGRIEISPDRKSVWINIDKNLIEQHKLGIEQVWAKIREAHRYSSRNCLTHFSIHDPENISQEHLSIISNTVISGIEGLTSATVSSTDELLQIELDGCNLEKVVKSDELQIDQTTTTNFRELINTFVIPRLTNFILSNRDVLVIKDCYPLIDKISGYLQQYAKASGLI